MGEIVLERVTGESSELRWRYSWPIVIKIKREIKSNVFPFQLKSNLRN